MKIEEIELLKAISDNPEPLVVHGILFVIMRDLYEKKKTD